MTPDFERPCDVVHAYDAQRRTSPRKRRSCDVLHPRAGQTCLPTSRRTRTRPSQANPPPYPAAVPEPAASPADPPPYPAAVQRTRHRPGEPPPYPAAVPDPSSARSAASRSTASAACAPESRLPPPVRASAWSRFSTVSTPNPHGTPVAQLDVLDPARRLAADVVVVVGLAADDRAEAGDAGVAAAVRAGCAASGSSNAPGHLVDVGRLRPRAATPAGRPPPAGRQARRRSGRRRSRSAAQHGLGAPAPVAPVLLVRPSPRRAAAPGGAACGRAGRAWRAGSARCAGSGRARSAPASVTAQPVALEAADLLRVVGEDADVVRPRSTRICAPMP